MIYLVNHILAREYEPSKTHKDNKILVKITILIGDRFSLKII